MADTTSNAYQRSIPSDEGLSSRKSLFVLVIIAGCFAVLWPSVFYPMLLRRNENRDQYRQDGCCEVVTEADLNTMNSVSELCTGDKHHLINRKNCRQQILSTCGVDIEALLLHKNKLLTRNALHVLHEIRSINVSLCLQYNFGLSASQLGVTHKSVAFSAIGSDRVRQERQHYSPRSEKIHPAFRERGRAMPYAAYDSVRSSETSDPPATIVEGRPPPLPGMRPPLGAGAYTPSQKHTGGSISILMPMYTIAIVVFFTYTIFKIAFRKDSQQEYPSVSPDPQFRKEVFEAPYHHSFPRKRQNANKSQVGDIELDHLRKRLYDTELAMQKMIQVMDKIPANLQQTVEAVTRGASSSPDRCGSPTVTVLGMETRASCEDGKKWMRTESPIPPAVPSHLSGEEASSVAGDDTHSIYLDASLTADSKLIVTDTEQKTEIDVDDECSAAVVLAGKMTLSVLRPDSPDIIGASTGSGIVDVMDESDAKMVERSGSVSNVDPGSILQTERTALEEVDNEQFEHIL